MLPKLAQALSVVSAFSLKTASTTRQYKRNAWTKMRAKTRTKWLKFLPYNNPGCPHPKLLPEVRKFFGITPGTLSKRVAETRSRILVLRKNLSICSIQPSIMVIRVVGSARKNLRYSVPPPPCTLPCDLYSEQASGVHTVVVSFCSV